MPLTANIMTAAASFIADGTDPALGANPIQVNANLVAATQAIKSSSWGRAVDDAIYALTDNEYFTSAMATQWNKLQSASSTPFYPITAAFSPNAAAALDTTLTDSSAIISWDFGLNWASNSVGGFGWNRGDPVNNLAGSALKIGSLIGINLAYADQASRFVNAANNADIGTITYQGSDIAMSAGFYGVSRNFRGLATDIENSGNLINWKQLPDLGSPGLLIQTMYEQGNLGTLGDRIIEMPLDANTIIALGGSLAWAASMVDQGMVPNMNNLGIDIGQVCAQGVFLPAVLQKQIYMLLVTTTGQDLVQLQQILGSNISGLTTGADLLNPMKYMPNSYTTLTSPVNIPALKYELIYSNASGSVNDIFNMLGPNLKGILPADQAIANQALSRSFQQVKNITSVNSKDLPITLRGLELSAGLPLIQNQTGVLPAPVQEFWQDQYNVVNNIKLGTQSGGQYSLADTMGYCAGINSTEPLQSTQASMLLLQQQGALANFINDSGPSSSNTGVLKVIEYFANGAYGPDPVTGTIVIPAGVYGAGTYTADTAQGAFALAYSALLTSLTQVISTTYSAHRTIINSINESNTIFTEQLAREFTNLARSRDVSANPNITGQLSSTYASAIGFAQSLHSYGNDTTQGGPAEILEAVSNMDSLGGQAIIATMREGRNITLLSSSSIGLETELVDTGYRSPATLTSGVYSS